MCIAVVARTDFDTLAHLSLSSGNVLSENAAKLESYLVIIGGHSTTIPRAGLTPQQQPGFIPRTVSLGGHPPRVGQQHGGKHCQKYELLHANNRSRAAEMFDGKISLIKVAPCSEILAY